MKKILEFIGKTLMIGLLIMILYFGFRMISIMFQEIIKVH